MRVKLKILYDNEAVDGFRSGWGFSCSVEKDGEVVLFDVGADLETLLFNAEKLSFDFGTVGKIVLSHEHGDHVGGIRVVDECGKVEVFVPKSFSSGFKRRLASRANVRLIEVGEAREIGVDIFTSGELGTFIKEQSLVVKTRMGAVVVTGCAHPGLEKILEAVSSRFGRIYGVVGGFHGFSKLEALKGLELIVPCHCTTRKRDILRVYEKTSRRCAAGCTISVPS